MRYIWTVFIWLFCALFSTFSSASSGTKISNVKCDDTWIRQGSSKIDVVANCGIPEYEEQTSGANAPKSEMLLYTIKNKKYAMWLINGKVKRIEMLK